MNAMSEVRGMVLNADGVTYRFPGNMQYPMDREQQRAAGLIAQTNVSIHPSKTKAGKTVWRSGGSN